MLSTKTISSFALFSGLKKKELKEILNHAFVRTLQKDEDLFEIDQPRDTFFILLAGEIGILKTLGRDTQIVDVVTQGEYISEHALLDSRGKHAHGARTYSSQARVLGFPGKHFQELSLEVQHKILINLLPTMSDNIFHASNRILAIFQIGQILADQTLSPANIGQEVLHTLLKVIKAKKGILFLKKIDPQKVTAIATLGFSTKEKIPKSIDIPSDPFLNKLLEKSEIINLSEKDYVLSDKKVAYITSSVLAVPFKNGNQSLGALLLIDKKSTNSFNTNNEVLLMIIAHMISLGLQHAMLREIHFAEQELKQEYISL